MSKSKHYSFFYKNGLSIIFFALLLLSLAGQVITGHKEHNEFLADYNEPPVTMSQYLISGHFLQATFENWESEFLQMALFVVFTVFLRQQGSSESNPLDESGKEDELVPKKDSPAPVRKGGVYLTLYKYSLTIVLSLLFVVSFVLHWYGSWLDHNLKQILEGKSEEDFLSFLGGHKFWFESFQNWQSEFLSVFAIVFLSIYLRQAGSSQSKPVNAPHKQTGPD
jgi:hypothetical protein